MKNHVFGSLSISVVRVLKNIEVKVIKLISVICVREKIEVTKKRSNSDKTKCNQNQIQTNRSQM